MRKIVCWLVLILLCGTPVLAQDVSLITTLRKELTSATPERRFSILNDIGFEYRNSFPDSAILYCTQAYELGKKLNLPQGLSKPLSFMGLAKANQGDYKASLDFHNRSIEVAILQNDSLQLAHCYNNLGRIFFDQGDHIRAYNNLLRAKNLFEVLHDKSGMAYAYRSLAALFKSRKEFANALENSWKALELRKELGNQRTLASAYMELGLLYESMDSTPMALQLFEKADSIATKMNDNITKAELKIGMAEVLYLEHREREAEGMAKEVIESVSETSNQKIFLRARILLAQCLLKDKDLNQAQSVLHAVYTSAEKTGNLGFQRDAAQLLAQVYDLQKNKALAHEYDDIFQILDGKLRNADLSKEIERLQFQLQIEKAEKENETLKARQLKNLSIIEQQRYQNTLLWIVAAFVAVAAISIWVVSRKRKIINKKLEDQNLHILNQREEISKQNEILLQSNHDLDEINHEKDTLMNIVAHDLKSPLNRIFGLARILEMEGNLNSNQHEYVRLIKESTRGGLDLITDLLDVHAWQELREKPNPSAVTLPGWFNDRVFSFRPAAETKGIDIRLENTPTAKVVLEPNYVGRIIDNLVSNAVKFSPRGSAIEVSYRLEDGYLKFSVKDSGPGFSEEDKKMLFQKFKKLSARPTAGESSNGLGLAIVKTLVDRLEGTIELVSTLQGSQFMIAVPARVYQEAMS